MKTFFVKPAFWISLGTFVVCAVILIFIFNYRSEDKPDQTNNLKEDTTADSSVSGDKSAVTSSSYTATDLDVPQEERDFIKRWIVNHSYEIMLSSYHSIKDLEMGADNISLGLYLNNRYVISLPINLDRSGKYEEKDGSLILYSEDGTKMFVFDIVDGDPVKLVFNAGKSSPDYEKFGLKDKRELVFSNSYANTVTEDDYSDVLSAYSFELNGGNIKYYITDTRHSDAPVIVISRYENDILKNRLSLVNFSYGDLQLTNESKDGKESLKLDISFIGSKYEGKTFSYRIDIEKGIMNISKTSEENADLCPSKDMSMKWNINSCVVGYAESVRALLSGS